jgi:hypothetical protein
MNQTVAFIATIVSIGLAAVVPQPPVESDLGALTRLARNYREDRSGALAWLTAPRMVDKDRALKLLGETYGIHVVGSYTLQDLAHVLLFARLQHPSETRDLIFEFAATRITHGGNFGEWNEDGLATIRSDRADTVFHEGMHHVLEYEKNSRGKMLGELIYKAALEAGSGKLPESCVTRAHARSHRHGGDYGEFEAELATAIAARTFDFPLETRVENPRFDPPARVQQLVRSIWIKQ